MKDNITSTEQSNPPLSKTTLGMLRNSNQRREFAGNTSELQEDEMPRTPSFQADRALRLFETLTINEEKADYNRRVIWADFLSHSISAGKSFQKEPLNEPFQIRSVLVERYARNSEGKYELCIASKNNEERFQPDYRPDDYWVVRDLSGNDSTPVRLNRSELIFVLDQVSGMKSQALPIITLNHKDMVEEDYTKPTEPPLEILRFLPNAMEQKNVPKKIDLNEPIIDPLPDPPPSVCITPAGPSLPNVFYRGANLHSTSTSKTI